MRARLGIVLQVLGTLLVLLGIVYGSWVAVLAWREQVSPSTQRALVLADGRQVPLAPATPHEAVPVAGPVQAPGAEPPASTVQAPTASLQLPPTRIRIPTIGLDYPVVLIDLDHLPEYPAVGWLLGSAFPGERGNFVLAGHLGGAAGTFMRLHELRPGDAIEIESGSGTVRYRVRGSFETTPDDVAVLLPGDTATATLITCSGPWDAVAQTNRYRLIVVADLVEP